MSWKTRIADLLGYADPKPAQFDIARLDLQPGDIIVLKYDGHFTRDQVDRVKADIALSTGGHRCMVLAGGLDIAVLSAPKGDEVAA